jgi:homospermidine synthase
LFKHFQKNLSDSELLVVIGYGFRDEEINNYLKKYFLTKNRPMIIIDPKEPPANFIDEYKSVYIPKSVIEVTHQEYFEKILNNLKSK